MITMHDATRSPQVHHPIATQHCEFECLSFVASIAASRSVHGHSESPLLRDGGDNLPPFEAVLSTKTKGHVFRASIA